MQNNVVFNLKQSIGIGDGKGARIKVSTDYETKQEIDTKLETVSVVFKNSTQIERFEASFSGGIMIIQKRGLSKGKDVEEKQEFKKQWNAGEMGYITILAHNLFNADKSIKIKAGEKIFFGGEGVYVASPDGENLKFKDINNNELSLSDLSNQSGQNNKVAITDVDTPGFLNQKLGKGFTFGTKVNVDLSSVDYSALEEEALNGENFLLTSNGKKAKVSSLFATEEDFKNGNSKFVTADQIGGELILYSSDEILQEFEPRNVNSNGEYIYSNLSSIHLDKEFEKICKFNGTYKVGIKYSINQSQNGSRYKILHKRGDVTIATSSEYDLNRSGIESFTFSNVKKGDKIVAYGFRSGYVNKFLVFGFLGRKIIKDVFE